MENQIVLFIFQVGLGYVAFSECEVLSVEEVLNVFYEARGEIVKAVSTRICGDKDVAEPAPYEASPTRD
jgi:hypothetical protein